MTKRLSGAFVALVAVALVLLTTGPARASERHDGHDHQGQHRAAKRTHKRARAARVRARAHRRASRRRVAYVCPMHPDIRERSRGTCPKCLMDLVAEPRAAKTRGEQGGARGVEAGAASPGRM